MRQSLHPNGRIVLVNAVTGKVGTGTNLSGLRRLIRHGLRLFGFQSSQRMHPSGFASIPFWANPTSNSGTQLSKIPLENVSHVSHGGTLSTSKKPLDEYLAAPSARFSSGA